MSWEVAFSHALGVCVVVTPRAHGVDGARRGGCVRSLVVTSPSAGRAGTPTPLKVAAALVVVEAVLLIGYGVAEVGALTGERATMGITTALFFLVYGAGLVLGAVRILHLASWARAPLVLAQLIQILVAWSFIGGSTTGVGVGLIVCALVVLIGIFHPASLKALADEDARTS